MRRILITNDDGIHAPGLEALHSLAREWGTPTVVAPASAFSGCGHQTTTDRELCVTCGDDGRYHVDGSPADCARLGLVMLDPDVDWVLSGINDGANMGVDIFMSGTVAAVREAALLGKPAIAFSQYRRGAVVRDWNVTRAMAARVLAMCFARQVPRGAFWNVNLPDVTEADRPAIVSCPLDPHPLPVRYDGAENRYRYAGDYHQRRRVRGSDVDVCLSGNIALSLVTLGECFAPWAARE